MSDLKTPITGEPLTLPNLPEIPAEFTALDQWVNWGVHGSTDKVPCQPNGKPASVTDLKTWSTYAAANGAVAAGVAIGTGFVFTDKDPFCGIDFDDCLDPKTGEITPEARKRIEALDSYTEISPSGTGVHVIVRAAVLQGRKGRNVEVYSSLRYFTVTGLRLEGTPDFIEPRQAAVDSIVQSLTLEAGGQSVAIKVKNIDWEADLESIAGPLQDLLKFPEVNDAWNHQLHDQGDQTISGYDLKLARLALLHSWSLTQVSLLIRRHRQEYGDTSGKGTRRDYVVRTLGRALAQCETSADDQRLRIVSAPGNLPEICRQIADALAAATAQDPMLGIYRYGNGLAELAFEPSGTALPGDTAAHGTRVIRTLNQETLNHLVEKICRFVRYDKGLKKHVPADVPDKATKRMLSNPDIATKIPILNGLVSSPVLRPDGTVLSKPGYDPESGLVFDPQGVVFDDIPQAPSKDDARKALDFALDFFKGFPFADKSSIATAAAATITPLVRSACPTVPMVIATAPKMGTGKSLLVTVIGYIARGRRPTMITESSGKEEDLKRLTALFKAGHTIIVIDNVEGSLKSSGLCVALTEPEFSARLLGTNDMFMAKSNATFFATGNNLVAEGDLSSRVVVISLDAAVERPEERTFEVDLHKEVPKRRGQLVPALLTIVLAYLHAGSPKVDAPIFGRFEHWCRLVRDPLMWLGMADACEGRRSVEAVDPVRQLLGALLSCWWTLFGSTPMKVGDVVKLVSTGAEIGKLDPEAIEELRQAMLEAAGSAQGGIHRNSLGRYIGKHANRIEGGLRFERKGSAANASRWAVIQIASSQGPTSAESGTSEVSEVGEVESGNKETKMATGTMALLEAGQKPSTTNKFSSKNQNLPNLPNLPNNPSAEPLAKPTAKPGFKFLQGKGKFE